MSKNFSEIKQELMQSLDRMVSIEPDTIPSMPLYMDQVRSFMESILSDSKRRSDDKILTKTMINNYAKNKLLPPPENKKYSREHIMVLIYIYYFKQMLSMNDIQKLMKPVYSEFSHASKLEKVFSQVMECCSYEKETAKKTALEKIDYIEENFPKLTEREEDFKLFLLISDLLCDIYSKKVIVERLIDLL